MRRLLRPVLALGLLGGLSGCGSGTFGIFAASSGSSGSGNAAPSLSQLRVESNKEACAEIRFTVSDKEADPATIGFYYEARDAAGNVVRELMTQIGNNPATFDADGDGEEYTVPWDFPGESNLPDNGSYKEPVLVIASLQGGSQELVFGANGGFGVGNDPPVITHLLAPGVEVAGIAAVRFTVEDSSGDVVRIRVEFNDDAATGFPDASWKLARPAATSSTPEYAFGGVEALRTGTDLVFFWDTDHDLGDLERDVRVRFTPDDLTAIGSPMATPTFRVDNNAEPVAVLDAGLILANTDRRRGIPLPFEVFDDEGDATQLVFQWRRPGEMFPTLPTDPARIREILADPEERREYRVASEFPVPLGGRVVPVGGTTVRLPELGGSAAGLLANGIVGSELEILRSSQLPAPVAAGWSENPLSAPVGALPLDDPLALVLDGAGGGWRLAWLDLATGQVLRTLGSAGNPSALAFESGGRTVLVASDVSGAWQLERVDLATETITSLVSAADGLTERGRIRGLASLGREAALITVASSLIHVRYPSGGSPGALALREGLHTPWGVLVDPGIANRIYLAERDAPTVHGIGRISTFALDTRAGRPVIVPTTGPFARSEDGLHALYAGFQRPSSLAFEPGTSRLLAITDTLPGDARLELRGVDLGGAGGNTVFELATLPGAVGCLATGADGLRLATLTQQNDLAVGGGVQQKRTLQSYDPIRQEVEVDRPFAPPLAPLSPWRVFPSAEAISASDTGTRRNFVWDSSDLEGGGNVLFRLVPFDSEEGLASESPVAKQVLLPFELAENAVVLGGPEVTNGPVSGAAADLDGDGDLDLFSANETSQTVTVFFQDAGVFRAPVELEVGSGFGRYPLFVVAGDLDADGDLDLVTANNTRDNLTIFFQTSPGTFDPTPTVVGSSSSSDGPATVATADLDGDGDLDLVSANGSGDDLTIFFQTGPGVFDPAPTVLGSSATIDRPLSVTTADLDGDGDLDLISANANSNTLTVFLQPAGGFVDDEVPSLVLGDTSTTNRARSVAAADLDGDGDLDLVSANLGPPITPDDLEFPTEGSNLTIFFQTSPGEFDPEPTILGDFTVTQDPSFVAAVDLDGDGDLDLAATVQALEQAGNSSNLALYYQIGPGIFTPRPRILGDLDSTGSPAALAAADLNGDGHLDLVSFNSGRDQIILSGFGDDLTIFYQVEPGRLDRAPVTLGNVDRISDVQVADLDGDGDLDLLASDDGVVSNLSLLSQRGPGVFDDGVELAQVIFPTSEAIGDLDGDGDLDVVVGVLDTDPLEPEFQSGLELFFQTDPGEFVPEPTVIGIPPAPGILTVFPKSLCTADLDGDGDRDLLSANWTGPHLTLFFQTSPGDFDPSPRVLQDRAWSVDSTGSVLGLRSFGPSSVVAADLDGDGDLDLASENGTFRLNLFDAQNSPGGNLTLFLQTSPGEFASTPIVIGESATRGGGEIDVADLDGDGDLDLFTANGLGDDLTLFYQTSPGRFTPASSALGNAALTNRPVEVEAADLDRDGDLDLISANAGREPFGIVGSVTVFEQTGLGIFGANPFVVEGPSIEVPQALKVIDLDGDGEMDLIVSDLVLGHLTVLFGGRE